MTSILVKIIDRTNPDLEQEAEGQLQQAGFDITYRDEADSFTVDSSKHGGDVKDYANAIIIVGKRTV